MVLQTVRSALTGVHWHSIGMATLTAIILLVLRFRFEKILVAVAVTTAASWFFGYQGAVVGSVPSGLPSFVLPRVDVDVASELAIGAAFITVIGLMEAMSIAKSIATKTRQQLDVNQELIGQGLSNIVGGLFQSFAVSGSFSRSAINYESGARTGFAMVVCSCVVMATLLFLTPLLYHLPQATLAVIIVFAVLSLIRVDPVLDAWRVTPKDGAIAIVTFLATLVLAPQLHFGIGIGVSLTLILYLHRSMRPHVAYLSRHPDGPLVDAEANDLALDQYIALIRFDGRLYFGDSSYFESKVLEAVTRLPELQFIAHRRWQHQPDRCHRRTHLARYRHQPARCRHRHLFHSCQDPVRRGSGANRMPRPHRQRSFFRLEPACPRPPLGSDGSGQKSPLPPSRADPRGQGRHLGHLVELGSGRPALVAGVVFRTFSTRRNIRVFCATRACAIRCFSYLQATQGAPNS